MLILLRFYVTINYINIKTLGEFSIIVGKMTVRNEGVWQGMNWIRQEKRLAIYLRVGLARSIKKLCGMSDCACSGAGIWSND